MGVDEGGLQVIVKIFVEETVGSGTYMSFFMGVGQNDFFCLIGFGS